jgi:alpha-amylase/alpha-mannosidase (GH57 family)
MSNICICFLWHMHQPFYKDLVTGEYKLPWTRMHALKDYYGMVQVLADFPDIHQTFNLVPSLIAQVEDYAEGRASDPFLRAALTPAEELSEADRMFVLQYFFQANVARLIQRYPRYASLHEIWLGTERTPARAVRMFDAQAIRDLQVLSQLAWFDEEYLTHDPDVRELVRKGRGYSVDDQRLIGNLEREFCGRVLPVYREFARSGRIEVTTTPFYHPILPLLCDTNIADVAHPYVPLPSRFQYPQDAREQVVRAREYFTEKLGIAPLGMWPSEGSVSDEVLAIAADEGFEWSATDNAVLARTLQVDVSPEITYRPYRWEKDGRTVRMLFRDHYLSDLIGFVYSRMGAAEAAADFLDRIRENCSTILASGSDALVPLILDGENAWEYYEESGRPFLRELYRRIQADPRMTALTVSEALARIPARPLQSISPGSWINANFDVWIGAEEDNKAWEYLLRARQMYDRIAGSAEASMIGEDRKRLAHEELLIAEGSDWCWWYGPEHESANRPEFDQLFRSHLANVYTLLGQKPPEELSRPIIHARVHEFHDVPSGPVRPTLDGEATSYFEWLGAGVYRVDNRSGAMHGQRFLVRELRYGSDGQNLYLRLDFEEHGRADLERAEVSINLQPATAGAAPRTITLPLNGRAEGAESVFVRVAELRLSLAAHGIGFGQPVRFQLSLWVSGLPMDALPAQGWIEIATAESVEWIL